jgi:predicted enzyme related to lactoylglutathione lyase
MSSNLVGWFEIYVNDMDRAQKFYEEVFKVELQDLPMEGMSMRCFPGDYDKPGATGTLVKMEGMNPGSGGTMVYFGCEDCAVEESRVEAAGGKVVQTKMSIGEHGFCSMVLDTEGNTIGLHSMA